MIQDPGIFPPRRGFDRPRHRVTGPAVDPKYGDHPECSVCGSTNRDDCRNACG